MASRSLLDPRTVLAACWIVCPRNHFSDDLKAIEVPTLVMPGDDDQVVPVADASLLSIKLLRKRALKIYKGYPHGMATVHADVIHTDLLGFIKS